MRLPTQAPWIYNVDPDQLFVKPLVAPGPAEGIAPALGYFYPNVNPEHPPFKVGPGLAAVCACACKLCAHCMWTLTSRRPCARLLVC